MGAASCMYYRKGGCLHASSPSSFCILLDTRCMGCKLLAIDTGTAAGAPPRGGDRRTDGRTGGRRRSDNK